MSGFSQAILNLFDTTNINMFVAFGAGFLTFFASCLLPLLPTYLAYISGITFSEVKTVKGKKRIDVAINSIIFTIGFTTTFVILGIISNKIYANIMQYKDPIQIVMGFIFITLGLYNLEIIKLPVFNQSLNIDTRRLLTKWNGINSLVIGIALGLAWTPCIGPVLGVILFWADQADTALKGITLLIAFGLGMGLPFILAGIGANTILEKLKNMYVIKKVVFSFLTLYGIFLITESLF